LGEGREGVEEIMKEEIVDSGGRREGEEDEEREILDNILKP
jgi:hypothetical protein